MTESTNPYQRLEDALLKLVNQYQQAYPSGQWDDVRMFLDHGEYGLAFESFLDELRTLQVDRSADLDRALDHLRDMMNLPKSTMDGSK